MKTLTSLPKNREFFDVYATMIRTVRKSKTAAQLVSASTEIGIIYSAALSALAPIFLVWSSYLAIGIAILGTAVIEIGLRVMMPQTVDAILYKRFQGLHLPMTITVTVLSLALVVTSGVLSFNNSKIVVDQVTPIVDQQTTAVADSMYHSQKEEAKAVFSFDSMSIANQYRELTNATNLTFQNRLKAKRRELENLRRREIRTELSFATRKDQTHLAIENLKAEQAETLTKLKTEEQQALTAVRTAFKQAIDEISREHKESLASVASLNQQAHRDRQVLVASYGLGLGWFTLVCLFIFSLAVVLDRVHAKGAGIAEKVDLSQYDFTPSIWVNAKEAIRERLNYFFHHRIKLFQDKTPPAPLPASRSELYDPTSLTNITVTLKLQKEEDNDGEPVIYIPTKRRQIGFQHVPHPQEDKTPHTKNSRAIKGTGNTPNLPHLKRRLKDYKKRLGRHTQKKLNLERKGEPVSKRTLSAIENNQRWVNHYIQLIQEHENTQLTK